ncbi:putative Endoribonuclease Dicer [Paratrimastix pyriformis]|uniref:Endoribonuclease Dicer n=1 Tax=Paratrimastix pyriformis TaxID=342808 RepID=A0ABQ8UIK8_9EUKA|nr:putative Endoribonuclease Dicer [Paratrimastix pyriformis]
MKPHSQQFLGLILVALLASSAYAQEAPFEGAPSEWTEKIARAGLLWGPTEPAVRLETSVANGYFGWVVASNDLYIQGVFNGAATKGPSHRARVPSYLNLLLKDSEPYASAIDMECNAFYRRSRYSAGLFKHIDVEQTIFASAIDMHILVHLITVNNTLDQTATIEIQRSTGDASKDITFTSVAENDDFERYLGKTNIPELATSTSTAVGIATSKPAVVKVPGQSSQTFAFVTAACTSIDQPATADVSACAQTHYQMWMARYGGGAAVGKANPLADQCAAWRTRYAGSGIDVEGNLPLAQSVNSSYFYIMTSLNPDHAPTRRVDVPPVAYLSPVDAKAMMEYRYARLQGARLKARSYDPPYRGPSSLPPTHTHTPRSDWLRVVDIWIPRSAPSRARRPTPVGGHGQLEQHITPDVAWALMQYYLLTNDTDWLAERAYPILKEIGAWIASRVTPCHCRPVRMGAACQYCVESAQNPHMHTTPHTPHTRTPRTPIQSISPPFQVADLTPHPPTHTHLPLSGVIPPDEYVENVNNSAYTNAAMQAAHLVGEKPAPEWTTIADNIYIPYDPTTMVHPEYDGYDGRQIKQADVIMMPYPLGFDMSAASRRADLLRYVNVTDPKGPSQQGVRTPDTRHPGITTRTDQTPPTGDSFAHGCSDIRAVSSTSLVFVLFSRPAMTFAMETIGFIDLDDAESAARYFPQAYANIHPPFGVWTETPTDGAVNFITGAGGFLQSMLNGYGGMRVRPTGMRFRPRLPPDTDAITMRQVAYLGAAVTVRATPKSLTLRLDKGLPVGPACPAWQVTSTTTGTRVGVPLGTNVALAPADEYLLSCLW